MVKEEQYNATDINMRLLNAFIEWEEKSCFMVVARENNLSRPYVCSVSERYPNSEKRIMIIGQETYDFPPFSDDWPEYSIQKWGVDYLEKQLWNVGNQRYNRSAFWKLFRYIESQIEYCPCWNNVDKAHQIIDSKTVSLTAELERSLNAILLSDGRTILQQEIAITKPSAVLFITGPYYYQSMAAALQISEDSLYALKPTVDCLCTDISEISKLELPVMWTYHPTYLNRNEKNQQFFSKAMNAIRSKLSN